MNEDYENYSIEDEEEDEIEKPAEPRYTMWTIVPRIMVTPTSGWAMAKNNGPSPELAIIRFFLPLCIITGVSVYFNLLYPRQSGVLNDKNALTTLLVNAVIQFCSFFIGYYLALVMAKVFLPKDTRQLPHTPYGKLLIMTGVATLAFFHILFEALPMFDSILVFLPLWTIFILFKGMEYGKIKSDKSILAIGVICVVTIASPTMIEWILLLFS